MSRVADAIALLTALGAGGAISRVVDYVQSRKKSEDDAKKEQKELEREERSAERTDKQVIMERMLKRMAELESAMERERHERLAETKETQNELRAISSENASLRVHVELYSREKDHCKEDLARVKSKLDRLEKAISDSPACSDCANLKPLLKRKSTPPGGTQKP